MCSVLYGADCLRKPTTFGVRMSDTCITDTSASVTGLTGGALTKPVKPAADWSPSGSESPAKTSEADEDQELTADIKFLHGILADIVSAEDPHVHQLFAQMTQMGLQRSQNVNDETSLNKMKKLALDISPQDALAVLRLFNLALNLVNSAEINHRLRLMQRKEKYQAEHTDDHAGPLPLLEDGIRGTIEKALANQEATKEQLFDQLTRQKTELVLTAHPTEVNRQTILRRYRRITETLSELDRKDLHPYQRSEALDRIRRDIAAASQEQGHLR